MKIRANHDAVNREALPIKLDYLSREAEPPPPILKPVCRLIIGFQYVVLIHYVVSVGCFFWQVFGPLHREPLLLGVPMLLQVPLVIVEWTVLFGASEAAKLLESGRQLLVSASKGKLVLSPGTSLLIAVYCQLNRNDYFAGPAYSVSVFADFLTSGLIGCVIPLFTLRFFQRPDVRVDFVPPGADKAHLSF